MNFCFGFENSDIFRKLNRACTSSKSKFHPDLLEVEPDLNQNDIILNPKPEQNDKGYEEVEDFGYFLSDSNEDHFKSNVIPPRCPPLHANVGKRLFPDDMASVNLQKPGVAVAEDKSYTNAGTLLRRPAWALADLPISLIGQKPSPPRNPDEAPHGRRALSVRIVATDPPAGADSCVFPSASNELPGEHNAHSRIQQSCSLAQSLYNSSTRFFLRRGYLAGSCSRRGFEFCLGCMHGWAELAGRTWWGGGGTAD